METYLKALDLWEAIESYYEVLPLPRNPTIMAQIKTQKEKKKREIKSTDMYVCSSLTNNFY